jgi:hypothetical protein
MSERVYEVVETVTITGVGYVRAKSRADAVEKAKGGQVEFDWDQGQILRRGDGIKAYPLSTPTPPAASPPPLSLPTPPTPPDKRPR